MMLKQNYNVYVSCLSLHLYAFILQAFFSDDEETPTTPKGDVVFHPRENPRALVIRPREQQWPLRASAEKKTALKNTTTPIHENGKLLYFLSHCAYGVVSEVKNEEYLGTKLYILVCFVHNSIYMSALGFYICMYFFFLLNSHRSALVLYWARTISM